MKRERHRLKEVGDLSKIPRQGTSIKGGGRLPGALSSIGALCPRAPRYYCPAAPSNDPNLPKTARRGLRAPFTLHSWKCSDWSVSWISGSRFPGGCCCCCCCCEAEDEPAVRPSSTFLMLNFLMVSLPKGGPVSSRPRRAEAPGGKESEQLKPSGGFDRGVRRSGEQEIIPTGRAATTGARRRRRRRALFLRGRRGCSGARRRLLTWWRPGSRRPAPLPPHPWPRGPAVPRRVPGSASLPLSAAARPAWPGYPEPVPDPACRSLPGRPAARCHLPEASVPGPPTPGRAGGEPRFQRRPRRWRQLGLRGAGCPVRMRAATPAPGPRLKSSSAAAAAAEGRGSSWLADPRAPRPAPASPVTQAPAVCFQVAL